jgi:hypothetical protein
MSNLPKTWSIYSHLCLQRTYSSDLDLNSVLHSLPGLTLTQAHTGRYIIDVKPRTRKEMKRTISEAASTLSTAPIWSGYGWRY